MAEAIRALEADNGSIKVGEGKKGHHQVWINSSKFMNLF
jgi:hypothetical protein